MEWSAEKQLVANKNKFFGTDGKAIMFALDDPKYTEDTANDDVMDNMVHLGQDHGADVTLGWMKLFERPETLRGQPGVLQVVASTDKPLEKIQIYEQADMERAATMGAVAVAVHINGTSDFESEQLRTLERVAEQAHKLGMAVLSHTYIRKLIHATGSTKPVEYQYANLRDPSHDAARYATTLHEVAKRASDSGADILKLPYVGRRLPFRWLVNELSPTPVMLAGGDKLSMYGFLKISHESLYEAGAVGIAVGRNVFERDNDKAEIAMTALNNVTHYNMHNVAAQRLATVEKHNDGSIPQELILQAKREYTDYDCRREKPDAYSQAVHSYMAQGKTQRDEIDYLISFDDGNDFDGYSHHATTKGV